MWGGDGTIEGEDDRNGHSLPQIAAPAALHMCLGPAHCTGPLRFHTALDICFDK